MRSFRRYEMGFNTNKKILGLTAITSIAMIVAGCAGSGSGVPVIPGVVTVNGGLSAGTSSNSTSVDATGGEQQVFNSFGSFVGVLPQGEMIVAGESFAVIPAGVPILNSLSLEGRASGDVFVNGVLTGVHIVNRLSGTLLQGAMFDKPLIMPRNRRWTIRMEGPFLVASAGQILRISQNISMTIESNGGATTSIPTFIGGTLPANGANSSNGQVMTAGIPTVFSGRMFRLTISHANGVLQKTQTLNLGGQVSYNDVVAGSNSAIPSNGVNNVDFSLLP